MATDFKATSIDLYVTSSCNRKCTYCFLADAYLASNVRMPVDMVRRILTWATVGRTIEEVTLLGGEPAAHPDFRSIVAAIAEHPVQIRTVTNGSRRLRAFLDDETVRRALSRVAVSLDTTDPELFDRLRGNGAYADALATIACLREAGIPFDINCTVVASVLDTLPSMLAFADASGADRLNIHWYSVMGRGSTHAREEAVSARDWHDRVLEPVARYQPQRDSFVVDCELAFAYGLPGQALDMCAVRDGTNLQFFPDGAVFSCGIAVDNPDLSGYLWRDGELVARPGRSELTLTSQPCGGCPLRDRSDGPAPVCVYNRLART